MAIDSPLPCAGPRRVIGFEVRVTIVPADPRGRANCCLGDLRDLLCKFEKKP